MDIDLLVTSENSYLVSNEFFVVHGTNFSNPTLSQEILSKVNSKIIYHNPDSQSWNAVRVLRKARKSIGKSKC